MGQWTDRTGRQKLNVFGGVGLDEIVAIWSGFFDNAVKMQLKAKLVFKIMIISKDKLRLALR